MYLPVYVVWWLRTVVALDVWRCRCLFKFQTWSRHNMTDSYIRRDRQTDNNEISPCSSYIRLWPAVCAVFSFPSALTVLFANTWGFKDVMKTSHKITVAITTALYLSLLLLLLFPFLDPSAAMHHTLPPPPPPACTSLPQPSPIPKTD